MSLPPGHLIHWPQPPGQPDSALTLAAAAPDPVLPPPDASLIFTRPLLFSIFAQNHNQPSWGISVLWRQWGWVVFTQYLLGRLLQCFYTLQKHRWLVICLFTLLSINMGLGKWKKYSEGQTFNCSYSTSVTTCKKARHVSRQSCLMATVCQSWKRTSPWQQIWCNNSPASLRERGWEWSAVNNNNIWHLTLIRSFEDDLHNYCNKRLPLLLLDPGEKRFEGGESGRRFCTISWSTWHANMNVRTLFQMDGYLCSKSA